MASNKARGRKAVKSTGSVKKSYGSTNAAIQEVYGDETAPMPPNSPPPPPVLESQKDEENGEPSWVNSNRQVEEETNEVESSEEESSEEESSEEEEDSDEDDSDEDDSDEEHDDEWADGAESDNLVQKKRSKKQKAAIRKPLRNCCHSFFILIQMIAIVVHLAMIGVQLIPIFTWPKMIVEQKAVRCYLAFFELMFILAEFDIEFIGLKNWFKRGVLDTFIGVLALSQRQSMIKFGFLSQKNDTSFGQTWNELWTYIIIEVVSFAIIAIGCLYFLLELTCMRAVRNRCRVEYQKRLSQYKKKMRKQK